MAFLYIIIIYMCFVFFLVSVSYYVTLFSQKEQYTREEISNVLPYIFESWRKLGAKYPVTGLLLALLVSSFIGLLVPFISSHWSINSAVFYGLFYAVFPILKERFDSTRVSSSPYYRDDISNAFSRYAGIILFGFGAGTGTSLMYNWAHNKELGFLWFILNLAVITVLEVRLVGKEIREP
jgi:TM2 domain-containing membrane protein YozV